jgi:5-carboxyvanillate decarboxylase
MLISAGALGAAAEAAGQLEKPNRKYRLVATEEACSTPEQAEAMRKSATGNWHDIDLKLWRGMLSQNPPGAVFRRLLDLEKERLDIMDQAGVDMHVLSLTSPGVQIFDPDTATAIAETANDRIAEAIKKHPTRYAGLASFAPQDPKRAAKEIERAITQLKLNGLIVNSHTDGEYLDEPKFWPILEAAIAVNAAIYIHPRNPPLPAGQYLAGSEFNLYNAIWGYQAETGLHAMRLIVNGIFDRYPDLKIVLGHMGEGLPYWLYRIDYMYNVGHTLRHQGSLKRKPSEYVKSNFLITTSGVNFHPTLEYCHKVLGPDNIMFAIDYPYQETMEAARFMQTAPLPENDVEKIAHGNAERIFHITPA